MTPRCDHCGEPGELVAWFRETLCPLHLARHEAYERSGNRFADDHWLDAERLRGTVAAGLQPALFGDLAMAS